MSGQTNSFHRHMNVKMTSTATSGPHRGRAIDTKVRTWPAPSIGRGVDQLVGDGQEELPGHEQPERLGQAGQHDAHRVVEQAQLDDHLELRDHDHLHRDHERGQDEQEQQVPAGEAELGEGPPGGQVDGHREDDRHHGDDDGVGQPAGERVLPPRLDVVGQVPVLRPQRHGHAAQLGGRGHRGPQHPVDGEHEDHDDEDGRRRQARGARSGGRRVPVALTARPVGPGATARP